MLCLSALRLTATPLNNLTPTIPFPLTSSRCSPCSIIYPACHVTAKPRQNINQPPCCMLHHLALQLALLYFRSGNQLIVLQPPKPLPSRPTEWNVNQISRQTSCEHHERNKGHSQWRRCWTHAASDGGRQNNYTAAPLALKCSWQVLLSHVYLFKSLSDAIWKGALLYSVPLHVHSTSSILTLCAAPLEYRLFCFILVFMWMNFADAAVGPQCRTVLLRQSVLRVCWNMLWLFVTKRNILVINNDQKGHISKFSCNPRALM